MAFVFWFTVYLSHGAAENWNDWQQGHAKGYFLAPCTVEEARRDAGHAVQVVLNNSRDLAPFAGTCPDYFGERTGIGTAGNSMCPAGS
jgi:hypothetical protein